MTDFSFVQEDDLWRGSEVHRIIELSAKGTLDKQSVPVELAGYLAAHMKFMRETGLAVTKVEQRVQDKTLGIRGRIDCAGLLPSNGKLKMAIVDFKTGAIRPAVALQLALGAHLLDSSVWFNRYAVRLKPDGNYSVKMFPLMEFRIDVAVALSCVQISRWKMKHRMEKI